MKDNFQAAFFAEASELLDELEYSLLELETETNTNDMDLVAKVFRALHTIKGSSGMFGYEEIAIFIHDIETVFEHIRNGDIKITQEIIGLTLSAKDQIGEMLNDHDKISSGNDEKTKKILIAFRMIIKDYNSKNKNPDQQTENKLSKHELYNKAGINESTYHIHFEPFRDFFLNGTNPVNLLNELKIIGHSKIIGNTNSIPDLINIDPSKCYSFWDIILTTEQSIDVINEVFVFVDETMCSLEIKLLDDSGKLNNKPAYKLLAQILKLKSFISKTDIADIIEKLKLMNHNTHYEKLSDYKNFEKLKDDYRNSGLSGLLEEIKTITANLNELVLKLETDCSNQEYLINISELLITIINITDYIGENELSRNILGLEKLIDCFIDKPFPIDSETIEVFIQGIDYLDETLGKISDKVDVDNKYDLAIVVNDLITKNSLSNNENLFEPDDTPDVADSEVLKEFLISTNEMLESLEENVLSYEKSDSKDHLNEIFRIVHTIKGDSMVAGLNNLVSYTDILENLLHNLRNGKIARTVIIIDIILKASATITSVIDGLNNGKYNMLRKHDIQMLKDLVLIYENREEVKIIKLRNVISSSDPKTAAFLEQVNQYKEMILISIEDPRFTEDRLKILQRLLNNLENAAKYMKQIGLLHRVQESKYSFKNGSQDDIRKSIYSIINFLSSLISGEISTETDGINLVDINESDYKQANLNDDSTKRVIAENAYLAEERPKSAVEVENRTMRIDEYKVDSFSNMIGELVIARNSYEYLLAEVFNQVEVEQNLEKKLNDNLHLFSRLTDDLQVGVLTLRMIPLKGIFQKYTRVIRDISKKQNKKIDFVTRGVETEVDKKIADLLSDPLIHLIRNSCDHGIELPEERIKLGKPETGTILLKASTDGGNLIIIIHDDGKGLDRNKIYEKAKKMGIDTEKYDDDTIFNLIFEPGFSTKTEVSELSGRGVGMDVVKTTIDKLGGSYSIKTEENIETEITFVIPMTIGLSDSLLIEVKGEAYALPVMNVVKTLKLEPKEFFRLHDRLGFYHRGEVIPTATLLELLNGKSKELTSQLNYFKEKIYNGTYNEIPVVIVQTKQGNYGIIVDKLLKNIQLSIKPVPECIAKSNVISGVSILGNGNVVLVLNPEKLI